MTGAVKLLKQLHIQAISQWHTVLVLISCFLLCFLPLRAEVTFYSVGDYATFRHPSSSFRKCRIIVPNVPQWAFRTRCCVVLSFIVFRYVSLIFPFVKGKTSGERSNNDRINDDATMTDYSCLNVWLCYFVTLLWLGIVSKLPLLSPCTTLMLEWLTLSKWHSRIFTSRRWLRFL